MARFVGGFGVPHTPIFAQAVAAEGPGSETGQLFATVKHALDRLRPDVLVVIDTDHLNTFFLDNLPVFAIGVTDHFDGPNDEPPALPVQTVPSHATLARYIRQHGIADGFDLALVQGFTVDHSVMIPLHFLTPGMGIPVIPVFLNGHVPPFPSAARCFALGRSLRAAIDAFPSNERVVVIGSGSFSLEVMGPRIAPGRNFGVPDPGWAEEVDRLLREGAVSTLIAEATEARMTAAGNVAGELLNWIAMLGAVGERLPQWLSAQPQFGHSYAAWPEDVV